MPWPEVKLTTRLPHTENAIAPPCAACSPSVSTAIVLLPEDVELTLGVRLLVDLAAFGRRRDRIEHAAVGDARFGVVGHELVAVAVTRIPG